MPLPMLWSKKYSLAPIAILILVALTAIYSLRAPFLEFATSHALPSSSKIPASKNVAVMIEDRALGNIVPLLLHFASVLGPEWPIIYYTSVISHPNSTAFRRAVEEGRISIRPLPKGVEFAKHQSVSEFLTKPWLWEQLAPAGHVLMFQADSIICSNSEIRIEDFLEYDFVGAPIDVPITPPDGHGEGYNGGFSLRNRSMILDIVNTFSWQGEKEEGKITQAPCVTQEPCLKFEDQWFYHKMKENGARLPTKEVASKFAVETIWNDRPLGFHQVERWNKDKIGKVTEWCPEYAMATNDLLVKHP
ncbi:uncharacterized protein BP5553_07475 [Venustampulla echinocandica]|uniref:DUF5672 domain-containing protein n=1 Tax=Venustampulla echinocandica TaxID=2656787 RepID=A0A370TGL7_9HELO|nr:uncharacterized protein BP5553_07475 [Venustampulla echinocandica]RDL34347.1 hypothetical protein BP5553_07475 [Venustampulla echinocandica]